MLALRPSKLVPLALAAALGLQAAPARAHEPSRWIAALPFGAGQFQNGDTGLGITFAVSEGALGFGTLLSYLLVRRYAAQPPNQPGFPFARVNASIEAAATMNRVLFGVWATTMVVGVIEAQVSFGPRSAAKEPEHPSIGVTLAPVPGGGLIGARALF